MEINNRVRQIIRCLFKARDKESFSDTLDRHLTTIEKCFFTRKFETPALKDALLACGLGRGDTVFVQASWRKFYNYTGTPEDVIRLLESIVGENGTIAMPSYGSDRTRFDVQNTPSSAGVLSEVFRLQPGVRRSSCTHFSVAAKGRLTDDLIAEHELSRYGFDEHSPCFKLAGIMNAKIVFLGLGKEPTKISIFHCAGAALRETDSNLKSVLSKEYESVLVNSGVEEKKKMYFRQPGHENKKSAFRKIFRSLKSMKYRKLSNLDIVVIDATEAYSQAVKYAKAGKYCYKNMHVREKKTLKEALKKIPLIKQAYGYCIAIAKAYMPKTRARIEYRVAYGKTCDFANPKTLSEKMLWLSLNTYRGNPLILKLCDKYLVREYVEEKIGHEYLNELYAVYEATDKIDFDQLPNSFALKVSQGCTTNIFCKDKKSYDRASFERTLASWGKNQKLYDKMMADIGGISLRELKKYYICEKYLEEEGQSSPTDYKIYCFQGVPRAILVIKDRFGNKTGAFMTPEWKFLHTLSGEYAMPKEEYPRPVSLGKMIDAAKKLSEGFPFVRVDMYDIGGKALFGEMTFFPNGCIHMQETEIDGKTMGELLDISELVKAKHAGQSI